MATARRMQRASGSTRQRATEPKTAAEVASAAPPATGMPSAHNLGAELESLAAAAGRFWHALGESGIPSNFKTLMFDNWQARLFDADGAASVTDIADNEDEEAEA